MALRYLRYPVVAGFTTTRDVLSDLSVQLGFLRARDYAEALLVQKHQVPAPEAKRRAKRVAPHVAIATDYIAQAQVPNDAGFLSAYYAALNLAKVYILFSPFSTRLDSKLQHGASYSVHAKESHSLLTEVVTLQRDGAISLLHRLLTGQQLTRPRHLTIGELLPFMQDVAFEWDYAGGAPNRIVNFAFTIDTDKQRTRLRVTASGPSVQPGIRARDFQACRNLKVTAAEHDRCHLVGPWHPAGTHATVLLAECIRRELLYYPADGQPNGIVCSKTLLFPEELPTILVFYYLSSVVRYKPEFLMKLHDTRYWPALATCRYHSLQKLLILLLSYVHQTTFLVHGASQ